MIEVDQIQYVMEMRGGGDIWRIYGKVFNHPNIMNGQAYYPSSPISFDETNEIVTSVSGKQYKIMSYGGKGKDAFIQQLKKDIERNGFEIH